MSHGITVRGGYSYNNKNDRKKNKKKKHVTTTTSIQKLQNELSEVGCMIHQAMEKSKNTLFVMQRSLDRHEKFSIIWDEATFISSSRKSSTSSYRQLHRHRHNFKHTSSNTKSRGRSRSPRTDSASITKPPTSSSSLPPPRHHHRHHHDCKDLRIAVDSDKRDDVALLTLRHDDKQQVLEWKNKTNKNSDESNEMVFLLENDEQKETTYIDVTASPVISPTGNTTTFMMMNDNANEEKEEEGLSSSSTSSIPLMVNSDTATTTTTTTNSPPTATFPASIREIQSMNSFLSKKDRMRQLTVQQEDKIRSILGGMKQRMQVDLLIDDQGQQLSEGPKSI